ncbi:MAG: hypothetical protein ABI806_19670 [Candidatus Solibacter sp.]
MRIPLLLSAALAMFVQAVFVQAMPAQANLDFLNHNRSVFDAHNCYPYKGNFKDRIDRALAAALVTGYPIGIEQDLGWAIDPATGKGRPVVTHDAKTTGAEPALRDHFFERVRPIIEKALADNDRARWPLIVVHFDFKSVQPELLHAVWDLLGEYQAWITTAAQTADPRQLAPFEAKPLLVLTEDADAQEEVFFNQVTVGQKLRLFGSAHTKAIPANPKEPHDHLLATLPPDQLLTTPPTNYRRWWNNSWYEVEEGGYRKAGDWTAADDKRLRALVDYAHKLGYWIRFYTLDGFVEGEDRGWGNGYNFGSHEAVLARWKAAIAAGVNLIATDQYEEFAKVIR